MSGTDLIDSVIDAHGGLARYNALSSITAHFNFSGGALIVKQRPELFSLTAEVSTREQKVTYRGISSSPDEEWVYTPSRVWKQSISSKAVLESRDEPFKLFEGHSRPTPWDEIHQVYFIGYAMWQYLNFPYLLKRDDVKACELDPHTESGVKLRVLEVDYPEHVTLPSHSLRQLYYFDENFALRRHDYAPIVMGNTTASHYSFDDLEAGGLKFHGLRRVVRRLPVADGSLQPMLLNPTSFLLVFTAYELHDENGQKVGSWALKKASDA